MEEITVIGPDPSTVCWNNLEAFARRKVQDFLQSLLEEEVTSLLGRRKSERQPSEALAAASSPGDGPPSDAGNKGYRNGFGKPRRVSTSCGTIEVRRPRVRGLEERFESVILPLFRRRTAEVGELLPELYLHGLSSGDFDLALRGLLGEGAPLSASSIMRLKAGWQKQYEEWNQRSLADQEVVYMWVDGVYVKAGLEKEKAALLVVLGALKDGSKTILAVEPGHRESTESWSAILRSLKRRGLNCPRLVMGDGNLGIWGALTNVFPGAAEQRCWNHRLVNILDRVPKPQQPAAKLRLRQIMYAESREDAEKEKASFQKWTQGKGFAVAGTLLDQDWDRLVAYYDFPSEHWKHLRTTNPIESPFQAVRLRTSAARRYKKVENATAVIWKTLRIAESRFRKLNAPERLVDVARGVRYENGFRRAPEEEDQASIRKLAA
jgi:transposase-like protein